MDLLADAVEAGKVRAVGVSNYSAEQMRIAHEALSLSEAPFQQDLAHWGVLTIGTGLGNAHFTNRSRTAKRVEP